MNPAGSGSRFGAGSPQALPDALSEPGYRMNDPWEAQKLASVLVEARVALFTDIPPRDVVRAHMEAIDDLDGFIAGELRRMRMDRPVAMLPEGPQTIPCLRRR